MTAKRTVPRTARRPRPPITDASDLEWVTDLLGITHSPERIGRLLRNAADDALWLPDLPDDLPEPSFLFQDVLQPELPFHFHGGEKTMKTSLASHIGVCTAAGVALFGHFGVDPANTGPALWWAGEGGRNYIHRSVLKVCAEYGIPHRSLDIEIHAAPVPLNSPEFVYLLADRVMALRPKIVFTEPLYLMSPTGWDGRILTDFKLTAFTNICERYRCIPGIGHHDKWSEASSGLRQSAGVGPAQWMGQWWHIERIGGDWDHKGPHKLKLTYGGRGVGGGRVGLMVDDPTLHVDVVDVDELIADTPGGHAKPTAYDLSRFVLPFAMNGDDVIKVGDLANSIAGQIQARYSTEVTPGHIQKVIITALLRNGVLNDVTVTGNEHTVTAGEEFPQDGS